MTIAYSQVHCTNKYSQHSSIIWPAWLNSWVFVCEVNSPGFESRCCQLNFRYSTCLEQGVRLPSGNLECKFAQKRVRGMIIRYSHELFLWYLRKYFSNVFPGILSLKTTSLIESFLPTKVAVGLPLYYYKSLSISSNFKSI